MSMMAERDMGRILLDLSDDVIQRLDDLKVQRNIPRAELLREAVEQYLEKQDRAKDTISSALGLWQDCEEDGMEYPDLRFLIPIFLLIYLAGVAKPNRRWRPGHRRMRSV